MENEQQPKLMKPVSCINNNKPNLIVRVSKAFEKKFNFINKKRKDNESEGLSRPISRPKFTELIMKHKLWEQIQEDIVRYSLEEDEDEY